MAEITGLTRMLFLNNLSNILATNKLSAKQFTTPVPALQEGAMNCCLFQEIISKLIWSMDFSIHQSFSPRAVKDIVFSTSSII